MKKTALLPLFAGVLCFSCGTSSNETTDSEGKTDSTLVAMDTTASQPDSATMMANWTAYMTPGKMHEMMKSWNGAWDAEVHMWNAPGMPADTTRGSAVNKMIMGDRYQVGNFYATMMGQPFEGMSTLAYDNAKKVFVSTWIDNMGTGLMKMEGPWDSTAKAMTLTGKMVDPSAGTGKEVDFKEVFTVIDDSRQKMEMYGPAPDGSEYKMMEIIYTRK